MRLDLELYKAFYHVARAGNLTHAAQDLHISQPALTKRIQQMEEQLGCRLFVRQSKGMALTPEGKELLPYAVNACETITAGELKVRALLSLEYGEVKIGASDLIMQQFLVPSLASFHANHPRLKVQTHAAQALYLLEDIRRERIDLAVVMQPLPPETEAEFSVRAIGQVQDIFVASTAFEHLRGRGISWAELTAQPIISLGKDTATRRFQDVFFAEQGFSISPILELSNTVLIIPCVEQGVGVGIIIRDFARDSLATGRIFALETPAPIPPRIVSVVTSKIASLSKAAQAFLDHFLS
ncbi:LysR family transcriptional regulator [Desulfovibrio sp. OttesenSCG-928-I05]|nr:LysR family transcriptional regulator [Desulfovibrio sp. OttesenSCG-928-I05]